MLQSITVKSLSQDHEIMPSRCRARNCCPGRGSYFDPATFAVTGTLTGAVLAVDESPDKGDSSDVDKVNN